MIKQIENEDSDILTSFQQSLTTSFSKLGMSESLETTINLNHCRSFRDLVVTLGK